MSISISTLASISIHTGLLIVCALVTLAPANHESPREGTEVKISGLAAEQLDRPRNESLDEQSLNSASENDSANSELLDPLTITADISPGDLALNDALALAAPSGAGGGGGSRGALDDLAALASGGNTFDGQATFMGAAAQGRRFCIVADRSGSMLGDKFDTLRKELLTTIDDMRAHTRVQIILFNTRAVGYPRVEWLHPRDEREGIETWLATMIAAGDTYPTPAFVQAFNLDPLPDAIFFMTDGQFDPHVVTQIRRLNTTAQRPVPIHTITFVDRSAAHLMRTIARESDGTYRHVD